MNLQQLDHALRAAANVTGHQTFLLVGSQSVLPWTEHWGDIPEAASLSREVDLAGPHPGMDLTELNVIGEGSRFDAEHSIHVDPVDWDTATMPDGWQVRIMSWLSPSGVTALCPEPHDTAAAKLAAGRPKDLEFVAALTDSGFLDESVLRARVQRLPPEHVTKASNGIASIATVEPGGLLAQARARAGAVTSDRCGKLVMATNKPCLLDPDHSGRCRSAL